MPICRNRFPGRLVLPREPSRDTLRGGGSSTSLHNVGRAESNLKPGRGEIGYALTRH
jgi:hypothetical protein